jgi:PAS domain S-box-containing protein
MSKLFPPSQLRRVEAHSDCGSAADRVGGEFTGKAPAKHLHLEQCLVSLAIVPLGIIALSAITAGGMSIPNEPAVLLLAVVYSAYRGGFVVGLASSGMHVLYTAIFFSEPHHYFSYDSPSLARVLVFVIVSPITAALVGLTRRQADQYKQVIESARWKAESAVQEYAERERLLIAAVESASDVIVTETLDGIITSWNEAAEHLFGFTAQEAIGNPINIIVPDELRHEVPEFFEKIKNGGIVDRYETVRKSKNGQRIDISISVSPLKSEAGSVIGVVKVGRDITDRKRADAELHRTRTFLNSVIDNLPFIITVKDARDLSYLLANRASEKLFKMPAPQVIGKRAHDVVAPEQAATFEALDRDVLNGRKSVSFEHDYEPANGVLRRMSARKVPVLGDGGEPQYLITLSEDITDRIQLEEERDRSRELLNNVIENITVTILVKNARTSRYVLINKAAERLWGLSRDELIGRTAHEAFDKETADVIEQHDRLLRESASNFYVPEHVMETPRNGKRLVTTNRIAIRDRQGEVQYLLGVVEDVTERKRIEDQLRQAQKMEAIGNLTGGVAHDFNNLLTAITGTIDILAEAVSQKPELAAIAKLISDSADRGAELTSQLLAFARKQPLQPRETEVNSMVLEAQKLMLPTLGERVEIKTILASDVWPALVDPTQLSSALLNLAINARDAMPAGGKLTLETSNVVLSESHAGLQNEAQPGEYVLIAVSDTGGGIPQAIRDKIFEPFFTTKGLGEGTGLGLSMVYGFLKQSGGYIKLYSEEGHGTTFKIYLPRARARAEAMKSNPAESQLEGGTETILVVENDDLVRASVTTQMRRLGYQTLSAASAAEAIAIANGGTHFDLLFTDVIMPGKMNGRELAEAMAKRRSPLKVLFTSGYAENAIVHHGRLDSGVLFLPKPYHKSALARMLRCALDGADGVQTRIARPKKAGAI